MGLLAQVTVGFLVYLLLILGLNFVVGKTSVWSVGHLGFFAIGALAAASVVQAFGPSWATLFLAMGAALVSATVVSLFLGLATLRLQQDSFVVLSLAFAQLVWATALSWKGPDGFTNVPRPPLIFWELGNDWLLIGLVFLPVLFVSVWVLWRFSRLPLNRVCALVRENEALTQVLGRSPIRYKVGCLALGSALAGAAGALATFYNQSTDPAQIDLQKSLLLFAAMLVGGVNSILGSVVGALIHQSLPRMLEQLVFTGPAASLHAAAAAQLVLGACLLVIIRWWPEGLAGSSHGGPLAGANKGAGPTQR